MRDENLKLIKEYLERVKTIDSREELKAVNAKYPSLFKMATDDDDLNYLNDKVYAMISELVTLREERKKKTVTNSTELSETEHSEIFKVQKLIDFNLFTYHFQPIVRADNGEIYSYEALMRARDMEGITPFHILKYAELTDRLNEVEQYTFLNVLGFLRDHSELFEGRLVFINSMPNVHIDPMKESEISKLLELLSDKVVVEMTENSEYNDAELNSIKEKYRGLNIRIAIDDYGTGYSNISNLLRYTPNYVKIDRSLLSGIQSNSNKKHFVREIIDFCHANGILALAEGVENSEELRTVILLGADLIQGFYIARPSASVLPALPYELREEIRMHRQEREDGKRMKIYTAEEGELIALDKLARDGYSVIRIGVGYSSGSVTVKGTMFLDSGIHIEIAEGFRGKMTLDSVRLTDIPGRPCVNLGENNDVTVILFGSSRFESCGIKVPESSRLTLQGRGNLEIVLSGTDYYGIGNDLQFAHGELDFQQDGTVNITAESHSGVCIGSGLGGRIKVERGRFVLRSLGSMGVCMGAFDGDADIDMIGCDFDAVAAGAHCAIIGSLNGKARVSMMYSSIKCKAGSIRAAGIGSAVGEYAFVSAESVSIFVTVNADTATAFGSLEGNSDIEISRSSVNVKGDGKDVLAFGGISGGTVLTFKDIDLTVDCSSEIGKCCIADENDIHVNGGKYRVKVNGTELDSFAKE